MVPYAGPRNLIESTGLIPNPQTMKRVPQRSLEGRPGYDSLRSYLVRGGIGSLCLKTAHTAILFFLATVLARTLGPTEYGAYSFALAIIMLCTIPAQVGIPQLLVRETAKTYADGDWGRMRGLWRWSNWVVVIFSILIPAIVVLVIFLGGFHFELKVGRVSNLLLGLFLIPLIALSNVRAACLQGLRRVVQGQLSESVLRPGILLVTLLLTSLAVSDDFLLNSRDVMGLHVLAAAIAFAFGAFLLRRATPDRLFSHPISKCETNAWWRAAIPFALTSGFQFINSRSDLIVLGMFRSDSEVGIYQALSQVSLLAAFGLKALNTVVQPYFARLYHKKERVRLQRLITTTSRIIFLIGIPPALIFIFFGGDFLAFVFGKLFAKGSTSLAILALAQLINAGFGPVGILLNMTGYERETLRGVSIAVVSNVVLNFALIPQFGMEGAATATGGTLLLWNILLRRAVIHKLGFEPTALPTSKKPVNVI